MEPILLSSAGRNWGRNALISFPYLSVSSGASSRLNPMVRFMRVNHQTTGRKGEEVDLDKPTPGSKRTRASHFYVLSLEMGNNGGSLY